MCQCIVTCQGPFSAVPTMFSQIFCYPSFLHSDSSTVISIRNTLEYVLEYNLKNSLTVDDPSQQMVSGPLSAVSLKVIRLVLRPESAHENEHGGKWKIKELQPYFTSFPILTYPYKSRIRKSFVGSRPGFTLVAYQLL